MDAMDSLVRIFYEIPGKLIFLHKDEHLFYEGDEAKYFYFVRSGQICITKSADSGRMLSLRLACQGSVIGEQPLFQASPMYIFNAVAKTASEVYAIELPVLERYLEKKPQFAVGLLKLLSQHMRKQHSKFRDLVLYGKKGALYSTLIRLANSYGRPDPEGIVIPIPFTNQDLANYSATTRESMNRMLSELRRDGVVDYKDRLILIRDIAFLRREIQCENCPREVCNIE